MSVFLLEGNSFQAIEITFFYPSNILTNINKLFRHIRSSDNMKQRLKRELYRFLLVWKCCCKYFLYAQGDLSSPLSNAISVQKMETGNKAQCCDIISIKKKKYACNGTSVLCIPAGSDSLLIACAKVWLFFLICVFLQLFKMGKEYWWDCLMS